MKKKPRIRWEVARANRNRTARNPSVNYGGLSAQLDLIEHKYNISSDGIGGTKQMGVFYSDGSYWETMDLSGSLNEGIYIGELTSATNAGP